MKNHFTSFGCALLVMVLPHVLRAQTYCTPTYTSCGANNYISYVSVGGMTNTTTGCATANYLNKIANVVAGNSTSMTVTCAGWDGISVFVDLNNDGDFTDTLENLFKQYKAPTPPITYTFSFTIPATTIPGHHRMRVNCGNGGSAVTSNPCPVVTWGNYHDYTMNITNNCPTDSNFQFSNITNTTASFSWAPRPGVVGYEYVLDTIAASPTSGGTPTTGTSYSATNLTKAKTYYFHLRTNCGGGVYSSWLDTSFVTCVAPNATIASADSVNICKGDELVLSANQEPDVTYRWYSNGFKIPGFDTSAIVVTSAATYHVTQEVPGGCTGKSNEVIVTVSDLPQPILNAAGHHLSTGTYAAYEWYHNGQVVPGAVDSTHIAQKNGLYFVKVTDANGCSANTDSLMVRTVGIKDLDGSMAVAVQPNPFSNELKLMLDKSHPALSVKVYNTTGQEVFSSQFQSDKVISLNLATLETGMYFVHIQSGTGAKTIKVVKE